MRGLAHVYPHVERKKLGSDFPEQALSLVEEHVTLVEAAVHAVHIADIAFLEVLSGCDNIHHTFTEDVEVDAGGAICNLELVYPLPFLGCDGLLDAQHDKLQLEVLIARLEVDELVSRIPIDQRVHIGEGHRRGRLHLPVNS